MCERENVRKSEIERNRESMCVVCARQRARERLSKRETKECDSKEIHLGIGVLSRPVICQHQLKACGEEVDDG